MSARVTRLAPSPTGALHLGNARTFLLTWAIARQHGWRLLMRIEDLDSPRVKAHATSDTLEILRWMGLDWDGEPTIQSADLAPFRTAIGRLCSEKRAFRCELSRAEILAATSAPHLGENEVVYPASLRPEIDDSERWTFEPEGANYRFVVADRTVLIDDEIAGVVEMRPCDEIGDFVIWTKRGVPSYQLAVVVDDARQGVTDVIRGDDLLPSAARQTLLYEALGLEPPRWWHLPLVLGPDGRRLAKRHGDTRLAWYREHGVSPERLIGLLAWWSGVGDSDAGPEEMTSSDFLERFEVDTLGRSPITFSQKDHEWLLSDG